MTDEIGFIGFSENIFAVNRKFFAIDALSRLGEVDRAVNVVT